MTWCYVIERPGLAVQPHAQKRLIDFVFDVLHNEVKRSPSNLLPRYYQEPLKDVLAYQGANGSGSKRIMCDLIAGMTEYQAITHISKTARCGAPIDQRGLGKQS